MTKKKAFTIKHFVFLSISWWHCVH